MNDEKNKDVMIRCEHPNGTVSFVPQKVFNRVVMEMENDNPGKYVTYKEGARLYRMSEKFFREWSNKIGATKHISDNKVIVSVELVDNYLKYL